MHPFLLTRTASGRLSTTPDTAIRLHTDTAGWQHCSAPTLMPAPATCMPSSETKEGEPISVLDIPNTCPRKRDPERQDHSGLLGRQPQRRQRRLRPGGRGLHALLLLGHGQILDGVGHQFERQDHRRRLPDAGYVPHGYIAERQGASVEDWNFTQIDPPGSVATQCLAAMPPDNSWAATRLPTTSSTDFFDP